MPIGVHAHKSAHSLWWHRSAQGLFGFSSRVKRQWLNVFQFWFLIKLQTCIFSCSFSSSSTKMMSSSGLSRFEEPPWTAPKMASTERFLCWTCTDCLSSLDEVAWRNFNKKCDIQSNSNHIGFAFPVPVFLVITRSCRWLSHCLNALMSIRIRSEINFNNLICLVQSAL